jgi:hypothetical protein
MPLNFFSGFFGHQVAKGIKIFPKSLKGHHSKLGRLREAEIPVQFGKLCSGFSVERSQSSEIYAPNKEARRRCPENVLSVLQPQLLRRDEPN